MRCVTGQLRTYLNLGARDNMQYNTLREQCLRWDRAQQRWSGLVAGDEQVILMDVDRVKGKGKWNNSYGSYGGQSKGYGSKCKGKGDKGYQKGKSDGKGKSTKMQKESQRKEMRKGKAKLTTTGSRAKERATSSATHVASLATSVEIAGRINRFVQFLRTQELSLWMQAQCNNQVHKDHQLRRQLEVSHRFPVCLNRHRMDSSKLSRLSIELPELSKTLQVIWFLI